MNVAVKQPVNSNIITYETWHVTAAVFAILSHIFTLIPSSLEYMFSVRSSIQLQLQQRLRNNSSYNMHHIAKITYYTKHHKLCKFCNRICSRISQRFLGEF